MANPRRILYVVNDAAFFLSHRSALAEAARAQGYEVHVATPEDEAAAKIRRLGFGFDAVDISRRGVTPLREASTLVALLRLYRRLRPDLVHHITIKPVVYGGIAARIARVPAVASAITGLGWVFNARGFKRRILRFLVTNTYRVALAHGNSTVIFQNPDDRRLMVDAHLVPANRTTLIKGSGVDMRRFVPTPQPPGIPLVVLASRMLWDKGIGEFVEAARSLRREGVSARFALVGDTDPGNPAAVTKVQLDAWKTQGDVEWWGRREDMPDVFAQSHLVCLPSYGEGVPKVLIEAAACARPIVATDSPGCREIVRHEESGLLVPIRDAPALASAMRRLIESAELRSKMGASGRELATQGFSVDEVIAQTLDVYEALLK